jgi:hypothetical protein
MGRACHKQNSERGAHLLHQPAYPTAQAMPVDLVAKVPGEDAGSVKTR